MRGEQRKSRRFYDPIQEGKLIICEKPQVYIGQNAFWFVGRKSKGSVTKASRGGGSTEILASRDLWTLPKESWVKSHIVTTLLSLPWGEHKAPLCCNSLRLGSSNKYIIKRSSSFFAFIRLRFFTFQRFYDWKYAFRFRCTIGNNQ